MIELEKDNNGYVDERKLDNIISKKIMIDNWSEQEIFEWAEERGYIDDLRYTEFFNDVVWDRPYLNKHTLENFIWDSDREFFYDELDYKFEEQYDIPLRGLSEVPHWIDDYEGEEYLAEHISGYLDLEIGDILTPEDMSPNYSRTDMAEKYKLVDIHSEVLEVEFVPEYGEPVYYPLNNDFILIWKEVDDEEVTTDEQDESDTSSESTESYWTF